MTIQVAHSANRIDNGGGSVAASVAGGINISPAAGQNVTLDSGVLILPAGSGAAPSLVTAGSLTTGLYQSLADQLSIANIGAQRHIFAPTFYRLANNNGSIEIGTDIRFFRDAAAVLAQRDGVNAQTWRLYQTFTDASNYERFEIVTQAAAAFLLRAGAAGTGVGRSLSLQTTNAANADTTRLTITANAATATATWAATNHDFGSGTLAIAGVTGLSNSIGVPAAAVDVARLGASDFAAGDARLYVQAELGSPVILGNDTVRATWATQATADATVDLGSVTGTTYSLVRITSSERYKRITSPTLPLDSRAIYAVELVSWESLLSADRGRAGYSPTAERVYAAHPSLAQIGGDGDPVGVNWAHLNTLILAEVQRHDQRISALERSLALVA